MYQIVKTPGGVTVAGEKIPYVRSVTVGVWVASGTRGEPPELNGISHYIEHMVFKGTPRHSAAELAELMDVLGGEINAYTTKELTCFYGRVLDEKLFDCAALLAEMLCESSFDEAAADTERGVILEEIGMYEDNPEDLSSEKLTLGAFAGTPLGYPILGTAATLGGIRGETLARYLREHYTSGTVIISVAGNYPDGALERIGQMFSAFADAPRPALTPAAYRPVTVQTRKKTEQSNIVAAFQGLPFDSERRYELSVLSSCVGGSMSSRLFQRVREQLGLCYSIYSYVTSHADTGIFGIYLGCSPASEEKACAEIGAELRNVLREGVDPAEVDKIKQQLRASLLMSLESTASRSSHIGKALLMYGAIPEPDELLARLDAVTPESVGAMAAEIFRPELLSLSQVAPKTHAASLASAIRTGLSQA